jgi:predicted nucleic-acid-binding protein
MSRRNLGRLVRAKAFKKVKRSKADTADAIIATHAPISESCPLAASSDAADELSAAIKRLNSSIERFRKTFDACKPKGTSAQNVEELDRKDPGCIDKSSTELLEFVNQLIRDKKGREEARSQETGFLKVVTNVENAVNVTFKYLTPTLKSILQVGVHASAVSNPPQIPTLNFY